MNKLKEICFGLLITGIFLSSSVHAETWFFDFGLATQTTPNYNNITNPGKQKTTGLINADGFTTGLSLEIKKEFNIGSTNAKGTLTPAADIGFPASATRDSFFGNVAPFLGYTAPDSQIELSGLDTAQVYDFTIFASRMEVTDNRQTQYTITGANSITTNLNATANESEVATAVGIKPTADGKIILDIAPGADNVNSYKYFYLGAMKIVSRTPVPETCGTDDASLNNQLLQYVLPKDPVTKKPIVGDSPYILEHWLYRPAGYSYAPCKKYPLLIWLHGAGETCDKGTLNALHKPDLNSPGYQILTGTAYTNKRPFLEGIIIEPQSCGGGWNATNIGAMITYAKSILRVDEDRIYVTGLSLGGGGTWAYAAGKSLDVAAIVPIAGTQLGKPLPSSSSASSSNSSTTSASASSVAPVFQQPNKEIEKASHVPTWAFHNYNDNNVGPNYLPSTALFRCTSHTHRQCTIEHIERMIPFASTRLMKNYSADDGATMADTHRTATLTKAITTDLLPTKWTWIDGTLPTTTSAKTIVTMLVAAPDEPKHQGWLTAYNMQEMWQWLYAQKRQPAPTLKIASQLITPLTATKTSGATVTISASVTTTVGATIGQVVTDLKHLGGSSVAPLTYDSLTKKYTLTHKLPVTGLQPGTKGIGIVAVDTNGNRTVRFVTFKIE